MLHSRTHIFVKRVKLKHLHIKFILLFGKCGIHNIAKKSMMKEINIFLFSFSHGMKFLIKCRKITLIN